MCFVFLSVTPTSRGGGHPNRIMETGCSLQSDKHTNRCLRLGGILPGPFRACAGLTGAAAGKKEAQAAPFHVLQQAFGLLCVCINLQEHKVSSWEPLTGLAVVLVTSSARQLTLSRSFSMITSLLPWVRTSSSVKPANSLVRSAVCKATL